MQQFLVRRSRAAAFTTAAAMAAVFAVPAVASAEVRSTTITSPDPDSVFDSSSTYLFSSPFDDEKTIRVSGRAPGAEDGDRVRIICTITGNGALEALPLEFESVEVQDEAFTADVATPPLTCRLRAVPASFEYDEEIDESAVAPFVGPRALGGGFRVIDYGEEFGGGAPQYEGVQSFFSTRGQRQGIVFNVGAASYYGYSGPGLTGSGGIYVTALVEDTYYRFLFGPSAMLGSFLGLDGDSVPEGVGESGLVVDGWPAFVAALSGDRKSKVLSRTLNPTNGDQTVVESAPVAFAPDDPGSGSGIADLPSAGITLERTTTQDKDGRQVRVNDVFRSTDGAAHRIEARYGESVYQDFYGDYDDEILVEPASFRIPWDTGDAYVVPEAGRTFGPAPAGPATIWLHGPRQDFSRLGGATRGTAGSAKAAAPRGGKAAERGGKAAERGGEAAARGAKAVARADDGGLPRRAEGALTFDSAPTDGKFLSRGALVVRFVRDVPAGGTTSIGSTLSQDLTPEGLQDLVDGPAPAPNPAPPLPASTPLPTQPPVVVPVPGLPGTPNPLPKLARSTGKILISKTQGRRLRDRKPVTVTTKDMPAGRYGVTIRRRVKDGRTIANGVTTIKRDGQLKVKLRLTKYGRRYMGLKKTRNRKSVKVRVIVTWTPPGKGRMRQQTSYLTSFR